MPSGFAHQDTGTPRPGAVRLIPEVRGREDAGADPPLSVLYVHSCGVFGGASRSLLELVRAFPRASVAAHLVAPRGNVCQYAAECEMPILAVPGISQFDNTQWGHYRGWRWLLLLREVWLVPCTVIALWRARRRWGRFDLVHVNDVTSLLAVVVAKIVYRVPVVLHVRTVLVASGQAKIRSRFVVWVVRRCASALIAIDETVARSLPAGLPVHVVHNSYAVRNGGRPAKELAALLAVPQGYMRIAMVSNLLPAKGVHEFVRAAALCKRRGLKTAFFIFGGAVRRLRGVRGWLLRSLDVAHDVKAEVEQLIAANNVSDCFKLIDFTPDVGAVYSNIDLHCFPSRLNAVGRPVFEAASHGVPSVVALHDARTDIFVPGQTGLSVPARDPEALADAIEFFYVHPEERIRMGAEARRLAGQRHDPSKNAARVLEIYRRIAGRRQRPGGAAPC